MKPRLFPSKTVSVMEPGPQGLVVVTAECREDGEFRLLGGGEAPAAGLEKGEIVSAADLSEAVSDAIGRAERSSGVRIRKLYFNFDEPRIESAWASGTRLLEGDGEIRPADVRAAAAQAERLVGDFEKKIVYSAVIDYVIDGKDPVADPVGVFGHELEVKAHFLVARAARWDAWLRLLKRAGVEKPAPALSGLSSAWGVLTAEERRGARIVWDLSADYWNGLVLERDQVREYRAILREKDWDGSADVLLAVSQELRKRCPAASEAVLTGEGSGDAKLLREMKALEVPVRQAAPLGMDKLSDPRHASLAGLVRLASDMEGATIVTRPEKGVLSGAREKVKNFLSDYF